MGSTWSRAWYWGSNSWYRASPSWAMLAAGKEVLQRRGGQERRTGIMSDVMKDIVADPVLRVESVVLSVLGAAAGSYCQEGGEAGAGQGGGSSNLRRSQKPAASGSQWRIGQEESSCCSSGVWASSRGGSSSSRITTGFLAAVSVREAASMWHDSGAKLACETSTNRRPQTAWTPAHD